jgi:MFS family permease
MPGGAVLTTTSDVNRIEAPVTWKAYLICAFASFGGIFFGYDSGYINGVTGSTVFIHTIEGPNAKHLTGSHNSLIVSILSAGTFFGALIAGDCADMIGRRTTIIIGCGIYMVGVILQVASHGLGLIVAGRLVAGIGVGFESAIVILYMSEIVSGKHFRKSFLQVLEADVLNSRLQRESVVPSLQVINSVSRLAS